MVDNEMVQLLNFIFGNIELDKTLVLAAMLDPCLTKKWNTAMSMLIDS